MQYVKISPQNCSTMVAYASPSKNSDYIVVILVSYEKWICNFKSEFHIKFQKQYLQTAFTVRYWRKCPSMRMKVKMIY